MFDPRNLRGVVIIAGHYGVGKTNLALNLCVDAAAAGVRVTCVDLDIVNPYFRTSDYAGILQDAGVELIAPLFAGTSLDSPGLSGRVVSVIESARSDKEQLLIIDAGGDDAGATALGRFSEFIKPSAYEFFYVVNIYRNLTKEPEDAAMLLREIEQACHLQATAVVNNSHLKGETTPETILQAFPFGKTVARMVGLPLLFQTVPNTCDFSTRTEIGDEDSAVDLYPVKVYVTAPWEL